MKTALPALVILLAVAFCVPLTASAVTLSNTQVTDFFVVGFPNIEDFITGSPLLSQAASPMSWGDGTAGTVDSAVFQGAGDATGLYAYTYRVNVSTNQVFVLTTPFLGNIISNTSFYVTGNLVAGDSLANFYGANGTVAPSGSQYGGTPGNVVFRETWLPNGIGAGLSSAIFGVFSDAPPTLVIANALGGGGGTTADPSVVSASPVPEPGTLLLLGSGLSGLATWGWRRRKHARN